MCVKVFEMRLICLHFEIRSFVPTMIYIEFTCIFPGARHLNLWWERISNERLSIKKKNYWINGKMRTLYQSSTSLRSKVRLITARRREKSRLVFWLRERINCRKIARSARLSFAWSFARALIHSLNHSLISHSFTNCVSRFFARSLPRSLASSRIQLIPNRSIGNLIIYYSSQLLLKAYL